MSIIEKQTYTVEQLLEMEDHKRFELVNGELQERNVSGDSSRIAMELVLLLGQIVKANNLGVIFGPDCGFRCFSSADDPERVRIPDVSFISAGRITPEQSAAGYIEVVPDLAVEVVSPNDKARELDEKLEEYLQAGVKLVWIIQPKTQTVEVHRPDGSDSRLRKTDTLSGESVIPGFECEVGELFPALPT